MLVCANAGTAANAQATRPIMLKRLFKDILVISSETSIANRNRRQLLLHHTQPDL